MNFEELSDDEWVLVSSLVSDEPPIRLNRRGRPRAEPRVVANAVLWILTTGESWSRLPARYPSGPTCRRRFEEWHTSGTLNELVKLLVERGRSFVYVPEPVQAQAPANHAQATQSVAAVASGVSVAEEVVEDDGLPAVYWKSPEAWQAPASVAALVADTPLADPIESMTRQLVSQDDEGRAPPAAHQMHRAHRAHQAHQGHKQVPHRSQPTHSGSVPRPADASVSTSVASRTVVPAAEPLEPAGGTPWTSATPPAVQVVEWRGCEIHLSVELARNDMYRAAVEILKDGKRLERSGLIGPPFEDCEAARHYAFDWACQWIEREVPASVGATAVDPAVAPSTGGVSASANGAAVAVPPNHATHHASSSVVTRAMPAVATNVVSKMSSNAANNVRIAAMQRYASSPALRNGGEARDKSSGNSAGAESRQHFSRYRTHLG
ncbi:transposase [Paraburkholderia sacchari]|uniref:Transposase n=1 Tax=Paraburkholderia sacchari TaxID=159450 RepID=A0A8T6Z765_9BURK|nr:transposase [Paraburkholderia sacchari]NLP60413.1 transposase [Paraburkholderia sacchari]